MIQPRLIGILGGTFDPIHNGHLAMAEELISQLPFWCIFFIPCNIPPHAKQSIASAEQRLMMVELALKNKAKLAANDIEIRRRGKSYTVNTLEQLRSQYPDDSLCLILGKDAFNQLNTWYQWQKLLSLCHLIVIERGGTSVAQQTWLQRLVETHQVTDQQKLFHHRYGKIYFIPETVSTLSATEVRRKLEMKMDVKSDLPAPVFDYIQQHHLYE